MSRSFVTSPAASNSALSPSIRPESLIPTSCGTSGSHEAGQHRCLEGPQSTVVVELKVLFEEGRAGTGTQDTQGDEGVGVDQADGRPFGQRRFCRLTHIVETTGVAELAADGSASEQRSQHVVVVHRRQTQRLGDRQRPLRMRQALCGLSLG